jgi:hypothetical protein
MSFAIEPRDSMAERSKHTWYVSFKAKKPHFLKQVSVADFPGAANRVVITSCSCCGAPVLAGVARRDSVQLQMIPIPPCRWHLVAAQPAAIMPQIKHSSAVAS